MFDIDCVLSASVPFSVSRFSLLKTFDNAFLIFDWLSSLGYQSLYHSWEKVSINRLLVFLENVISKS